LYKEIKIKFIENQRNKTSIIISIVISIPDSMVYQEHITYFNYYCHFHFNIFQIFYHLIQEMTF
jgi:hypothetical protein